MKATGIVRRVDELGRVVIPKEIRQTLRIKEGCPLELYIEGDSIIFRPYKPMQLEVDKLNKVLSKIIDSYAIYDYRGVREYLYPSTFYYNNRYPEKLSDVNPDISHMYPVVHNGETIYTVVSDKTMTEAHDLAIKVMIESLLTLYLD